MHCYNHRTNYAIGLCKRCHKGLCQSCCYNNPDYLTCSEGCLIKCREMDEIEERAKIIYGIGDKKTKKIIPLTSILFIFLGLIFIFYNVFDIFSYSRSFNEFNIVGLFLGILFTFFGFLYWRRAAKIGLMI